jgi:hypothetical protein
VSKLQVCHCERSEAIQALSKIYQQRSDGMEKPGLLNRYSIPPCHSDRSEESFKLKEKNLRLWLRITYSKLNGIATWGLK